MDAEWTFPQIGLGTIVEASPDPKGATMLLGLIVKPKRRSADIMLIGGGVPHTLVDCWHVDDPRLKTEIHLFGKHPGGQRGVFRLAQSEQMLRRVPQLMGELRARVDNLEARVKELEAQNGKPQPRDVRPPGPRRQPAKMA